MNEAAALEHEAQRQQWLLRALWRDVNADASAPGWLSGTPAGQQRGLHAYRVNAAAAAERALAIAYPTVAALIGAAAFGALARDLWRQHPPERGDLGEWGARLPDLIGASAALAGEPYLADSARLDWCVHCASRAADAPAAAPALDALATHSPDALRLVLRPGCALLSSPWPVVALWCAHQGMDADRFDAAREALAAGRGEHAFVWRDGFEARVQALDDAAAGFTQAVLCGATLARALDAAHPAFAFDRWLVQALRQHWLVAVQTLQEIATP